MLVLKSAALAFVMSVLILPAVSRSQGSAQVYRFDGRSNHGWLGVMITDVTPRTKEKKKLSVGSGALVTAVTEDSPADKAGIEEGDVIVGFDGKRVEDSDDLTSAVRKAKPRNEVSIEIVRKDEHKTLTAKLGRESVPRAFSYNFNGLKHLRIPRMPAMPGHLGMYSSEDLHGIEVQELTRQLADYFEVPNGHGVLVSSVEDGSDAGKAGVKAGDVITKAGGSEVRDPEDLRDGLSPEKASDVSLEIVRKGKAQTLTLHVAGQDDDEEEDDDDGASFNSCPPGGHSWNDAAALSRGLRHEILDHVMQQLQSLQRNLRERLESVGRTIRSNFTRILDGVARKAQTTSIV